MDRPDAAQPRTRHRGRSASLKSARKRLTFDGLRVEKLEDRWLLSADAVVDAATVGKVVAHNVDAFTAENKAITINVLAHDTIPKGNSVTAVAVVDVKDAHGKVTVDKDKDLTYTPDKNFTGEATFTYKITGKTGGSSTATVSVFVSANDNERFLVKLYEDLLDRNPSAKEVDGWLKSVKGNLTATERTAIVNAFLNSDEYHIREVEADYQKLLGRSADTAGLTAWKLALTAGEGNEQVEVGIIASDEFFAKHGKTDAGFITAAFQDELGRKPSANELKAYEAELKAGDTRTFVAEQIVYSPEHASVLGKADFKAFTGKAATAAELATFEADVLANASHSTNDAAAYILASDAFYTKA